jgi:ribosomal protein S18 acetylase RimI-like enzyme
MLLTDNIIYRRAMPHDAEEITSLFESVLTDKSNSTAISWDPSKAITRANVEKTGPRSSYLVAEQIKPGKIIGLLTTEPYSGHLHNFDHVTIMGIYVSTQYQRNGIGTGLLKESEDFLKNVGFQKIFTYVRVDNLKAISFSRKNGFRIIGTAYDLFKKEDVYINGLIIEKKI